MSIASLRTTFARSLGEVGQVRVLPWVLLASKPFEVKDMLLGRVMKHAAQPNEDGRSVYSPSLARARRAAVNLLLSVTILMVIPATTIAGTFGFCAAVVTWWKMVAWSAFAKLLV